MKSLDISSTIGCKEILTLLMLALFEALNCCGWGCSINSWVCH